jgi:hypothetical protein
VPLGSGGFMDERNKDNIVVLTLEALIDTISENKEDAFKLDWKS